MILKEISGWCARRCRGWRNISQSLSKNSQEINFVQSYKKNSSFRSYELPIYPIFYIFPWIFKFKDILKLFPEQIQNYGLHPVNQPCGNLAY